ncbi:MAG: hypothetical protein J6Z11_07665 [Candidatus Riflebacteria bacterium]|nr:hypothetical protein [Candidatus Riflebacteria bacterium]
MGEILIANYATNEIEKLNTEERASYEHLTKEELIDMLLSAKATIDILENELAGRKHD